MAKSNPFARVTAGATDEELEAIAVEYGLERMTPARRHWRALRRRAEAVAEALEHQPDVLEAWLREGERLAKGGAA